MNALSLRTRLTAWYTVALVVVLSVFGANVLWGLHRLGLRRVDRDLDNLTATVGNLLQSELEEGASLNAAAEDARRSLAIEGSTVAVFDESGDALAANWGNLTTHTPPPAAARSGRVVWTIEAPRGGWRAHAEPRTVGGKPVVLLVASSLGDARREQNEVLEAMQIGIPLMLLLAGGGGFWLASVGLRPITEMARRAEIMPLAGMDDLGHADRPDELGQLARAFNGLVARLRTALRTQQQFMADASHELRTPVSVVRAAADVALNRDRREETEYRETLTIVSDQARRLSRLVDNMLVLARADGGGYPLRPVDLYLDDLVADCCRALQPLSGERQVTIRAEASPEIPFRGDEDLLRQLVLNVMQNAVQHTPSGGSVSVGIDRSVKDISIRVTDTGPGIPLSERERIFDRFVQLDPARRGAGTGLGLPIAQWIAQAHDGTLVLEASGPGGSTFCMSLPRQSSEG